MEVTATALDCLNTSSMLSCRGGGNVEQDPLHARSSALYANTPSGQAQPLKII